MNKKRLSAQQWQVIRRDWQEWDGTIAALAKKYGIAHGTLSRRIKGWREEASEGKEPKTSKKPTKRPTKQQVSSATNAEAQDHLTMVQRLYNATDQQIRHLEQQHESGEAAFDEKEARMLGTIARTLDKIMDLTSQKPAEAEKPAASARKATAGDSVNERPDEQLDLDRLRQDLAQRLDRLQQGGSEPLSGEPVGSGTKRSVE